MQKSCNLALCGTRTPVEFPGQDDLIPPDIRLDRLGRSFKDLPETVEDLEGREINLISLEERIDTTSAAGELVFHVLGAIAQFECQLISQRTKDGLATARKHGRNPGRHGNRLNKPLTRLYFLNRGVRAHLFFRRFRMSCTPNDPTAPAFLTHFQAVEDPRQEGKVLYPLEEILLLVLCGVISGADGWTSIALYGQKKLELLRRFLPYENGTPSHDQLGILFSRLDMEVFQSCFISWVANLNEALEGVVAVDGKTLRRSFDSSSSQAAIHMVSAWACDQKLVLGQRKVDDKSNEITVIPELLELLRIKGAIVTIDAMGCHSQRKICKNPVIKRRIM